MTPLELRLRDALSELLSSMNQDDDGDWFICAEAAPAITEAFNTIAEAHGQTQLSLD